MTTTMDFDTAIARYCAGEIDKWQMHDIAVAHGKGVWDVWMAIDRYHPPSLLVRLRRRVWRMLGGGER